MREEGELANKGDPSARTPAYKYQETDCQSICNSWNTVFKHTNARSQREKSRTTPFLQHSKSYILNMHGA